jgi:sugar/nucleoside kinase (ribokinase family)
MKKRVPKKMKIDVFGLGNPLVDILVYIDEDFLRSNQLAKGVMHLIDEEQRKKLINLISGKRTEMEAGGSCPNTISTLALLGIQSALAGKIGKDELGGVFKEKIAAKKVYSCLKTEDGDTGTSIILITPDKERTMNTHLGVCRQYKKEDLPVEILENSSIFYFTGYMWDTENQKAATRYAIKKSKKSGVKIIFDMADPFAVNRYRDDFLAIIQSDVDIVLANAQESQILTGKNIIGGARKLGELAGISVVKNGAGETYIYSGGELITVPSYSTDVKDTTGAGDNFSAGFIYGLTNNYSLEICGRIASFVASKTIEKIGAQAPENIKESVEQMLEKWL